MTDPGLQGRAVRRVANENDENSATTRLTRAKAASLTIPDDASAGVAKKPLQAKKSAANALANAQPQRKRAALGDVSNVVKGEAGDMKDGKKVTSSKMGLTSKATTISNGGVQKLSRTNSSRSALGVKDNNAKKPAVDLKRAGSGSGVLGNALKRRNTNSTASSHTVKEDTPDALEPPKKKLEVEQRVTVEVKSTQVVDDAKVEEKDVKEAFAEAVKDLDTEDLDDPLMAAEYVVEIFDYLRELEEKTMPNPDYMYHQDDLEWKMRGILVDWLIEVHTRFRLLPETLFLAVNIIDRFLSAKVVQLDRLQLVGVTAMFIASKYEEVLSPHVGNFRHVADDGFSENEILSAERYVLSALDYDLSYPNPMNFLRRISKADQYDIQTRTLGKYLMEISLLDHRFMQYRQSHIAAASMYLARLILERGAWVCLGT